jgi:hypothetical protein
MTDDDDRPGPYLPPGTPVRHDGWLHEGGQPEYGVVVHCWLDDEIGAYDCYIAFFGSQRPTEEPTERPYVLRYSSTSVVVLDPDPAVEEPPLWHPPQLLSR